MEFVDGAESAPTFAQPEIHAGGGARHRCRHRCATRCNSRTNTASSTATSSRRSACCWTKPGPRENRLTSAASSAKMLGASNGGSPGVNHKRAPGACHAKCHRHARLQCAGTKRRIRNRVDQSRGHLSSLGGVVFLQRNANRRTAGQKHRSRLRRMVHIDVRLDAVVLRALEKTPELRWQTAADLRTRRWKRLQQRCHHLHLKDATAAAVERAVTTISECAEDDPRLQQALQALRPLNQSQVVNILAKRQVPLRIRNSPRAAIYVFCERRIRPTLSRLWQRCINY